MERSGRCEMGILYAISGVILNEVAGTDTRVGNGDFGRTAETHLGAWF